jgi:hypothetical protein
MFCLDISLVSPPTHTPEFLIRGETHGIEHMRRAQIQMPILGGLPEELMCFSTGGPYT